MGADLENKNKIMVKKEEKSVQIGRKGEDRVAEHLSEKGYTIIKRNFRTKFAEIDIIAKNNNTICFVEVKNWAHYSMDNLGYSVNKVKQKKILNCAKEFLYKEKKYRNFHIRFDLAFSDNSEKVRILTNAFGEG